MIGQDLEGEIREEIDEEKKKGVKEYLKKFLKNIERDEKALTAHKKQYQEYLNMDLEEIHDRTWRDI